MTELEAPGVVDHPPNYIIFVVVFLFFLTGLFGFLFCQLLKKKGYRCRTGDMDDEEEEEKLGGNIDDEDEENQDTVEQILKCIIENEANMEAFNEMFGNHVHHDPRLRKESVGSVPPHHHTVHSGTDHNTCHLCAQVRSKKARRQSRTPRSKQRPGEQTVFSVGRFRVTHTDKKLHGGPNPLVGSGDQLDQSQDSEERKEGVYNLRSMFKDVRSPSEGSNGVTVNVGKRRKSVTLFGLRRSSDPIDIKEEGTRKDTGGVRFAIQQQPVVLEELMRAENIEVANVKNTKPGIKPETEPSKSQTAGSINFSQGKDLVFKSSSEISTASAPSSLPIPSPGSSAHLFKTTAKQQYGVEDKVLKNEDDFDPGPLQTSTPIVPMPEFIPVFTPVSPTGKPEQCSSQCFSTTKTTFDPSSSLDLESGLGQKLALISVGPSPPSSLPIKAQSSSSLKMPTSPLVVIPLTLNSGSEVSVASMTKGDPISSPLFPKEPNLEAPITPKMEEKTEKNMLCILKMAKPSPVEEDSKGTALYPLTDQLFKDRLSSLPRSPSSSLCPSSPMGNRISSSNIFKASPDSKRQFPVDTMMEDEISFPSTKKQNGATSEKAGISPAVGQEGEVYVSGVAQCESQCEKTPRAEVIAIASKVKDDMVEMEDIRDCKVTQVQEEERVEEEKMVNI
uniref:RELT like 2 n=1 Tax=Gasterosteus aculeatus aculeatus TaxID=481459 RepID=A0AAQ4RK76_GASAC|nr:RELT-like protein 2 isoform X1 [Gasterosteus aculeatus aculeatus]XP_040029062.1 RELT-like protein 2 isoform X1 [Gasterosteus aculeatus aculeatus]XP_040029063.1 RELT-like protein 2 isoform X1 [Gasterosteus aculeatus aculeatus]XP_040029064.1 RELT-like protein 2 isoform X1 [Gasterosteus aculeatus aculeatus]XP_040029065.1 RELT-like protein 2 isoform X1 [Gasterosteus aculeatus aculeatus]